MKNKTNTQSCQIFCMLCSLRFFWLWKAQYAHMLASHSYLALLCQNSLAAKVSHFHLLYQHSLGVYITQEHICHTRLIKDLILLQDLWHKGNRNELVRIWEQTERCKSIKGVAGRRRRLNVRYQLLLTWNKSLKTRGHTKSQLVNEGWLVLAVYLNLDACFVGGLICGYSTPKNVTKSTGNCENPLSLSFL